ncbi:MAG: outer membrane lipoprotein carrier protein LolA, partial [Alphaproteobacteria bacterium]
ATTPATTSTGFTSAQRAQVDKVSAYLSNMQQLIGDFVQVGPDGSRVKGEFFIQKPGKVRFEYEPPSRIEIVADGQSVIVRDRKLATQDLYPLSQTPLRFLLADRIDLLKETNVVSVGADDTFLSLQIEEKQTLGGTHKVLLMFSVKDMQLKQWTITDPQGYDTTVALYNLDPTQKIDSTMFRINYERKEIIQ